MEVLLRTVLAVVLTLWVGMSGAQQNQSEELREIQKQIAQKQRQIDAQLSEAQRLNEALKTAELEIAKTARTLNETERRLTDNQQQQTQLRQRQSEIAKSLDQQQSILASQLRSAYMTGDYDYAKLLFNQQDAAKLERSLTYYRYLNQARQQQISDFRALAAELTAVNAALEETVRELESLRQRQTQQRDRLAGQQRHRKQTLSKIEQVIDSEAAQIEQLQINEQALRKAIAEAAELASRAPQSFDGLASLKGKLTKPTDGRVRQLFGKRRQGQVRWKGVLISGNSGSPVRAIHDGKVLYSDWLRGFGLVTVVDHGMGYMSLYGYNQALLKQVGDSVQSGETIALVGQSGGQSSPNLYFEIRFKGKAVNPSQWLAR